MMYIAFFLIVGINLYFAFVNEQQIISSKKEIIEEIKKLKP